MSVAATPTTYLVKLKAIAISDSSSTHAMPVVSGVGQAPTEDVPRSVSSTPHIMRCADLAPQNVVVVQSCVEK